jgi:serine protease AprX
MPAAAVNDLRASAGVLGVTRDSSVKLQHAVNGYDAETYPASLFNTAHVIGADTFWSRGILGSGVDVALIDSGVVPVQGLTRSGKVVNGPDLSPESQDASLRYMDTFGHGTHMAGIIAGRDQNFPETELVTNHDKFAGIAPGARVVSVKVADAFGNTDVSQVIAGIDWVVKNRNKHGMNIRVLNLSFGTDGVQPAALDPLSYAAEVAWRKGIVVVVAAGNKGYGSPRLNNPAFNQFVIAVGSADTQGTETVTDDVVSNFSSRGTEARTVDLVAPGRSIASLRDPGSFVDQSFPSAQTGVRFFKGSGTSQAAAVVSGAAALVLEQRPELSPDQLKELLTSTAATLSDQDVMGQGDGLINLRRARWTTTPLSVQTYLPGTGLGTLEGARGTLHLYTDNVKLEGERDIFGTPWNAATWASRSLSQLSWVAGAWNGVPWTGSAMDATSWAGPAWGAITWPTGTWAGTTWSTDAWSKNSWSGSTWTGDAWARNSWSGDEWAKNSWSKDGWLSDYWVERAPLDLGLKNSWSDGMWSTIDCLGVQPLKNSWSAADWSDFESSGSQVYKNSWSSADWSDFESSGSQVYKNSWSSADWSDVESFGSQIFKNSWSSSDWSGLGCFGAEPYKNSWSSADWSDFESSGSQVYKNSWSSADWSDVESFGSQIFKNSWSNSAWE